MTTVQRESDSFGNEVIDEICSFNRDIVNCVQSNCNDILSGHHCHLCIVTFDLTERALHIAKSC